MKISRFLAIAILDYLLENPSFYFPFQIVFQSEDYFEEVFPKDNKKIKKDKTIKQFELLENLQDLDVDTTELLAKGFIERITKQWLYLEIEKLFQKCDELYKIELTNSIEIEEYGYNEFMWGKKEAFKDVLELMARYK